MYVYVYIYTYTDWMMIAGTPAFGKLQMCEMKLLSSKISAKPTFFVAWQSWFDHVKSRCYHSCGLPCLSMLFTPLSKQSIIIWCHMESP